ncbi:MAG: carbohydrate-binding family 9-like protein [Balneolaceae bacterium]
MKNFLYILILIFLVHFNSQNLIAQPVTDSIVKVQKTKDFTITGTGKSQNWANTTWIELRELSGLVEDEEIRNLATKVKVLYSDAGIYFLFICEDEVLTATIESHFKELWREDVVEIFIWPDESELTYFEYELSPLNYELPLLVSNNKGKPSHWLPFDHSYKEERKTVHKTSVKGGEKESGESITEWSAEIFIPFELLQPLNNIFPESGSKWRANMYRIDYDKGSAHWAWQPIQKTFHDFENYGTLLFE